MKTLLKFACAAAGAGTLAACSTGPGLGASRVVPVYSTGSAAVKPDTYVLVARRYELQHRFAQAEAAYRSALAQDGAHVAALRGLAVLRAHRRDYPEAAELLARAARAAPDDPEIANDLGYARLLQGKTDEAAIQLARATTLAPSDARAWNNYGAALSKLGRQAEAEQAFARAASLLQADKPAPLLVAPAPSSTPTPSSAPAPSVPAHPPRLRTVILPAGSGVVEVRFQQPGQAQPTPVAAPGVPAVPAAPGYRPNRHETTEIRNGNGVTGLARRFGHALTPYGYRVVRLTNAPGFSVPETRIEFRPGHEQSARALQRMLPHSKMVTVARPGPDILLVLGHDIGSVAELDTAAGSALVDARHGALPSS